MSRVQKSWLGGFCLALATCAVAGSTAQGAPILLASGQNRVSSPVVEGSTLYYITGSGSGPYTLNGVPAGGGTINSLVTINAPAGHGDQGAYSLMYDDTNFFGFYGGYAPGAIWKAPKTGGTASYLKTGINGGALLGIDNDSVFYYQGFGSPIRSMNKDGSGDGSWGGSLGWPRSTSHDDEFIYTQDYYSRDYYKISKSTGTTSSLSVTGTNEFAIVLDDNYLYFINRNNASDIRQHDKNGTYLQTLVSGVTTWAAGSDGNYVYYYDKVAEEIRAVPVAGGTPLSLASIAEADLANMTVGNGQVFWADRSLGDGNQSIFVTSVPEPTSALLLAVALPLLAAIRRRARLVGRK